MLAFVNVTDVVWIRLRFQPIWFHGSSDVPFERCTPISRESPTRAHIASYHKEIPPHSDGRKTGLWMINPDGICKVQGSCYKIWRARSLLYRSRVLIWNSKAFRDLQAFRTFALLKTQTFARLQLLFHQPLDKQYRHLSNIATFDRILPNVAQVLAKLLANSLPKFQNKICQIWHTWMSNLSDNYLATCCLNIDYTLPKNYYTYTLSSAQEDVAESRRAHPPLTCPRGAGGVAWTGQANPPAHTCSWDITICKKY